MNLYRQHSDDLNAYLYHLHEKGPRSKRPRRMAAAGAVVVGRNGRHACCEERRPIPPTPPQRWFPAPPPPPPLPAVPVRHGLARNHRPAAADPGFASLPRSPAMLVDEPSCSSRISSRQQAQVRSRTLDLVGYSYFYLG